MCFLKKKKSDVRFDGLMKYIPK